MQVALLFNKKLTGRLMQSIFEKLYQLYGVYFLIKTLHALAHKFSLETAENVITRQLYGVLSRRKPALSIVKLNSRNKVNLQKSRYASEMLLRPGLRNNAFIFKYMRLKKYQRF